MSAPHPFAENAKEWGILARGDTEKPSEDQLHSKEQTTTSDAVGGVVAGKGEAAVAVEVGVLEAAAGDIVQNRVRDAAELRVKDVEGLRLELGSQPLGDLDVLEERQVRRTDVLSAKSVARATGKRS